MARPAGKFDQQRDQCYALVKGLAGLGFCFATSRYLGKRMGVGEKQIQRYLKDLKSRGLIEVRTSAARIDPKTGKLFRKRFIRATCVPNNYAIGRTVRYVLGPVVEEDVQHEFVSTAHDQAAVALAEIKRQREEREAMIALSDALNPDKQFDEEAILRELQAELAAEGIHMELNTNGNTSP